MTPVSIVTLTLTVSVPAIAVSTAATAAVIGALVADLAAKLGVSASWITVTVQISRRGLVARQLDARNTLVTWLATVRPPPSGDAATAASLAALSSALTTLSAEPAASLGVSLTSTFQTMASAAGVSTTGFSVSNIGITNSAVSTPAASPTGAAPGTTSSSQGAVIGGVVGGVLVIATAVAAAVLVTHRRRAAAAVARAAEAELNDGGGEIAAAKNEEAPPPPPLLPPLPPLLTTDTDKHLNESSALPPGVSSALCAASPLSLQSDGDVATVAVAIPANSQ